MMLLAFAPTISRVRSVAGIDHAAHTHATHGARSDRHAGDPAPDDCWSRCGYCDFLAHAPAIGHVAHVATVFPLGKPVLSRTELAIAAIRAAFAQAAQPRGPPELA